MSLTMIAQACRYLYNWKINNVLLFNVVIFSMMLIWWSQCCNAFIPRGSVASRAFHGRRESTVLKYLPSNPHSIMILSMGKKRRHSNNNNNNNNNNNATDNNKDNKKKKEFKFQKARSIEEALKAGNWVLKSRCIGGRRSKHPIYERGIKGTPTYQTWVGCSTPSDNFNKSGLAFLNRLNRQRAMEEYEY